MIGRRGTWAALVGVGVVAAVLVPPSPALAKATFEVTVAEQRVKVGETVTVTVHLDDDGGISAGTKLCLFQVVGDEAPRGQTAGSFTYYEAAPGSKYTKVADCRRPAPDQTDEDPVSYGSGSTTYKLKVESAGWLAFAAYRRDEADPNPGYGPQISNVVHIGGTSATKPAQATLLSIRPAKEPAPPPSPSGDTTAWDTSAPAATATATTDGTDDDLSSEEAAQEAAERASRPSERWLATAVLAGFALGVVVTGVAMTLRSRVRAGGPPGDRRPK